MDTLWIVLNQDFLNVSAQNDFSPGALLLWYGEVWLVLDFYVKDSVKYIEMLNAHTSNIRTFTMNTIDYYLREGMIRYA